MIHNIVKLELCPIVGDRHPALPPYKFEKLGADRTEWYHTICDSNSFGISFHGIQDDLKVGFVAGYLVRGEDKRIIGTNCLAMRSGFIHVMYLWVDPHYRRQRIGWNLLNLAVLRAETNGYYKLSARVQDDSIPSMELFKKFGFVEPPVISVEQQQFLLDNPPHKE